MSNIIHVVEGRQSDDPDIYDGQGVPGAKEWQFSDGPPGERGSSADFQSLEEGLRAFPGATFKFHLEPQMFTVVLTRDVTMSTFIQVQAQDMEEAKEVALAVQYRRFYTLDDNPPPEAYVSDAWSDPT